MKSTCHYYPILMKLELLNKFFKILKYSIHENISSESRVVPFRGADGQSDMTKLIVAFQNFAIAPGKSSCENALQKIV